MYEKKLVESILRNPLGHKWTAQGLGMLRLYLSDSVRLHIWDSILQVPFASPIHTHPWNFDSYVVAGVVHNRRFEEGEGFRYNSAIIKCGKDTHITNEQVVLLRHGLLETYCEGQHYWQHADEIHHSTPENGTVTIVERKFKADTEHARVFWTTGDFVSAEPRPARDPEVLAVAARALERWFK